MDNEILGKVCFHTVLNCNSKNRLVGQSKRRYRKSETAGFIFILLLFSRFFITQCSLIVQKRVQDLTLLFQVEGSKKCK